MKQVSLFKNEEEKEKKYTTKIECPKYEPKNKKPYLLELFDDSKSKRLIAKIKNSDLDESEKQFLILAAYRHVVFNYEKIADYYANSDKKIQELMEQSALVIIDFESAIENGYVKLCDEIRQQYLTEHGE